MKNKTTRDINDTECYANIKIINIRENKHIKKYEPVCNITIISREHW